PKTYNPSLSLCVLISLPVLYAVHASVESTKTTVKGWYVSLCLVTNVRAAAADLRLRRSRQRRPRERVRVSGSGGLLDRRFRIPTRSPNSLTPSQVPPAKRSFPARILGSVDHKWGGTDGRS